jgi:hypothetical protein
MPLPDTCPDDLFCSWAHQNEWHAHTNGYREPPATPQAGRPWVDDPANHAPPGAVPDNPASEPWWVPSAGTPVPTEESRLRRLLGARTGPGMLAPVPEHNAWFSVTPRLGDRVVDDCRWSLEQITGSYPGHVCAMPACPGGADVWYLLAAPMAWLGWLWWPADNEPLRLGLCREHAAIIEQTVLADPERRVDVGIFTSADQRQGHAAVA